MGTGLTESAAADAQSYLARPGSEDAEHGTSPQTTAATSADEQLTAEQIAYRRGQRDMLRQLTTPRMTGYRAICGIWWSFLAVVFTVVAFTGYFGKGDVGGGLVSLILSGLCGWYAYRIWTLKARRLWLII
jgi:hypothetical protein